MKDYYWDLNELIRDARDETRQAECTRDVGILRNMANLLKDRVEELPAGRRIVLRGEMRRLKAEGLWDDLMARAQEQVLREAARIIDE